ncbi:hypothetical protein TIFTF001_014422 [Ficus carica]|uniref:Uncharacterized protein n=1 Tax=Ficus carica TaxID=3494 RepID=A0AA88A3Q5_FICCA|nr:hypothetical protein TIFTF001_014422 [Ficus carica]
MNDRGSTHYREADNHGSENGQRNVPAMAAIENVDVNADDGVDDVAFGTGPSTGPQHHDTRRDAMNMLRDMMADDMWDRFQSAPWYRTTQALAS